MVKLNVKVNGNRMVELAVSEATSKTDTLLTKMSVWKLTEYGYSMCGKLEPMSDNLDAIIDTEKNKLIINNKWRNDYKIQCDILIIYNMIMKDKIVNNYNYYIELSRFLSIGTEYREMTKEEMQELGHYINNTLRLVQ